MDERGADGAWVYGQCVGIGETQKRLGEPDRAMVDDLQALQELLVAAPLEITTAHGDRS